MTSRRTVWLVVVAVLVTAVDVVPAVAVQLAPAPPGDAPKISALDDVPEAWRSPALCGPNDTPETGIQGDIPRTDQEPRDGKGPRAEQGYNCGLAVVGFNDLDGSGGGAMAWSQHCAYVVPRGGSGINVIDVSEPTAPEIIGVLDTAVDSENIHAVTTGDRALLAAARTGAVDLYDVRDCESPRSLGSIEYPKGTLVVQNVHNLKLSPDGTKLVGTMPLTIADISDLGDASTWTPQNFQCDIAKQIHPAHSGPASLCEAVPPEQVWAVVGPPPQIAHEPTFDPSGTRLYVGGQLSFAPEEEYVRILDLSVWPEEPPRVISEVRGPGHGINFATIDGTEYLLNSAEGGAPGGGCQPHRPLDAPPPDPGDDLAFNYSNADAFLTNIDEEEQPTTVSRMKLAINRPDPQLCAAQIDSNLGPTCREAGSAATTGCTATPHYTMVDDPNDTTFAMLSMMTAGLRIWDVRDPAAPIEVAYFNSGQRPVDDGSAVADPAGAYAHYDEATGHIWLTTRAGGFWVLELEPQVREGLDLEPASRRCGEDLAESASGSRLAGKTRPQPCSRFPDGNPARPAGAATAVVPAATAQATNAFYCGFNHQWTAGGH